MKQKREKAKKIANADKITATVDNKDGKPGRTPIYSPEVCVHLEQLASQGLNNNEIADAMGISRNTFYRWLNEYREFSHSLKKYRGIADIEVENALFKSAVGSEFTEVKKERKWNRATGQYEFVLTEEVTKMVVPSTAAQIFYLKNRMPQRYKDKVETEISLGTNVEAMAFAIKRRDD